MKVKLLRKGNRSHVGKLVLFSNARTPRENLDVDEFMDFVMRDIRANKRLIPRR